MTPLAMADELEGNTVVTKKHVSDTPDVKHERNCPVAAGPLANVRPYKSAMS